MADHAVRTRSRRRRAPDLPLTGLLALQCFILVVAAPLAAMEFVGGRALLELCVLEFGFFVLLISDSPATLPIIACVIVRRRVSRR